MTGDACIAGDAYPVDASDLTPLCRSSCDSTSLSTNFVKMPIGKRHSTFFYLPSCPNMAYMSTFDIDIISISEATIFIFKYVNIAVPVSKILPAEKHLIIEHK